MVYKKKQKKLDIKLQTTRNDMLEN